MKTRQHDRPVKVVKIYQSDFDYVTKHFYTPFVTTIADAVEAALADAILIRIPTKSRSSGKKGSKNGSTKKEDARSP
jgi:hypothetical protein